MAHSNRVSIQVALVVGEALLFLGAIGTAYWSQKNEWTHFFLISAFLLALFVVLKISAAFPAIQELIARDDVAAQIALSAIPQGLTDYYDMQKRNDQDRRNRDTQNDISTASAMWLCANSGASYLDPGIYRHWPVIEKRLQAGIDFRIVLLDPFSGEKGFRNRLNVEGEHFDSKLNLASLIKLYNQYPTLSIQFAPYGMHATVFAVDQVLYLDPYQVGVINDRIENRSFSIRVSALSQPDAVGIYRIFKSHLNTLLQTGEPFEAWLERCSAMLPAGLPALKRRQYTR